jgi:hypothetical protein
VRARILRVVKGEYNREEAPAEFEVEIQQTVRVSAIAPLVEYAHPSWAALSDFLDSQTEPTVDFCFDPRASARHRSRRHDRGFGTDSQFG